MFKITKKITVIALIISFVIVVLLTLFTAVMRVYFYSPASEKGDNRTIIIKEGMHLKEISIMLESEGLIKNAMAFRLLAKIKGCGSMLKAGEYNFNPNMIPGRIMEMLTRGEIIAHTATIPEGFSIEQIADVLSSNGLVDREKFLLYTKKDGVEKNYGIEGPGLEGYLYPDTYHIARGLDAKSIADIMVKRFREITDPFDNRIAETGMTLHEVITLASIVEKETGKADERPIIASVFHNRLRKHMRLESDPTVIYGIENFSGNLTKKDLNNYSPYNTYVIRGLPPGPIANPGLDSIKAVLYPAETNYLYFVSKNDGSHYFSSSLKEHNKAVYQYQKKKKK